MKSVLFTFLITLFYVRCITTTLPQVLIPEKTNKTDFSIAGGTGGLQFTAMYTTKSGIGFIGSFAEVGSSDHGELSLAFVRPNHFLVSMGVGNANFDTHPLVYGGTRGIYNYWGYFSSASVRANIQIFKSVGWANSVLFIYGKENGTCNLICNRYNTHHFTGALLESVFYVRGKKHPNRYYMLHGSRILGDLNPQPPDERIFSISPLHFSFGIRFPGPKKEKP